MFCTNCGKEIAQASRFCAFCGTAISSYDTPPPLPDAQAQGVLTSTKPRAHPSSPMHDLPLGQSQPVESTPRPWVRFWARWLDIYLFAIVLSVAIVLMNPNAFDDAGSSHLLGLVLVFAWVFVESLMLSTIGTTPGKWLLKVRLTPPSGGTPGYSTALSRSFKVWWRGLGIGFPIVSLITLIVAHGKLTREGATSWDRDEGFSVEHDRIGPLRILVAVVFFSVFFLLMVAANA